MCGEDGRGDIEVRSKDALTEKEKSRIKGIPIRRKFCRKLGSVIILDPGKLIKYNNIVILVIILFYSVL